MTNNNPPQPADVAGGPEQAFENHARYIHEAIEMLPDGEHSADLIRAIAKGLQQRETRATQPATTPGDVASSKAFLTEQMRDPEFAEAYRQVSAEVDAELIAEKARRATQRLINGLPYEVAQHVNRGLMADIIAAEFQK